MKKSIFASKGFKKVMGMIYGLGAAVVIIGAWAKILHLPGANVWISVGLLTEAGIFIISAFEPVHEEPDWTLVYPELAGMEGDDRNKKAVKGGSVSQQLDKMLEEAKVGPELISSLGTGLKSLSENVTNLSDLSNAAVATNSYTENVQKASKSLENINTSYTRATEAVNSLADASSGSKAYYEQMQRVTNNLNSLNAMYEMELNESSNHVKALNGYYGKIENVLSALSESETQAGRFKDEMAKLSTNLTTLNGIYGNMLSAMTVQRANG